MAPIKEMERALTDTTRKSSKDNITSDKFNPKQRYTQLNVTCTSLVRFLNYISPKYELHRSKHVVIFM